MRFWLVPFARLGLQGDSIILGFHTPQAALQCAMDAQTSLLVAEWPAALLEHPLCAPQYVTSNCAVRATQRSAQRPLSRMSRRAVRRGLSCARRHPRAQVELPPYPPLWKGHSAGPFDRCSSGDRYAPDNLQTKSSMQQPVGRWVS